MNIKQEILKILNRYALKTLNNGDPLADDTEAADQIDTLYRNKMLEVIGEDEQQEFVNDRCADCGEREGTEHRTTECQYYGIDIRNALRAELREAIDNIGKDK